MLLAAPVFQSNEDRPHNVNKSVGDSVVFNCKAHADPPATIKWYKNGVPINGECIPSLVLLELGNKGFEGGFRIHQHDL